MNFGTFLKLIPLIFTYLPNAGEMLLALVNAKTWGERGRLAGEIIDTLLANKAAVKACIEANAFSVMSEAEEEAAVIEACGLFRRKPGTGGAEAEGFDLAKLKALYDLVSPYLPLLLKLLGI